MMYGFHFPGMMSLARADVPAESNEGRKPPDNLSMYDRGTPTAGAYPPGGTGDAARQAQYIQSSYTLAATNSAGPAPAPRMTTTGGTVDVGQSQQQRFLPRRGATDQTMGSNRSVQYLDANDAAAERLVPDPEKKKYPDEPVGSAATTVPTMPPRTPRSPTYPVGVL
eukprot:6156959-Pyramimonas_sp.AAC.1